MGPSNHQKKSTTQLLGNCWPMANNFKICYFLQIWSYRVSNQGVSRSLKKMLQIVFNQNAPETIKIDHALFFGHKHGRRFYLFQIWNYKVSKQRFQRSLTKMQNLVFNQNAPGTIEFYHAHFFQHPWPTIIKISVFGIGPCWASKQGLLRLLREITYPFYNQINYTHKIYHNAFHGNTKAKSLSDLKIFRSNCCKMYIFLLFYSNLIVKIAQLRLKSENLFL